MKKTPHEFKCFESMCFLSNRALALIAALICIMAPQITLGQDGAVTSNQAAPARANVSANDDTNLLGSISGRVTTDDGQPLTEARVSISKIGSGSLPSSVEVGTDGAFTRGNLPRGLYQVSAFAAGYVQETDPGSSVTPNYFRPGDVVSIRMTKGSVITGRVTDGDGHPVVSVLVRAIKERNQDGRRIADQGAVERYTDDRGIYRIYGLSAGVYKVAAGGSARFGGRLNAFDRDVPVFYPSSSREGAEELALQRSEELTNVDIKYRSDRGHLVSGSVHSSPDSASQNSFITFSLLSDPSGAVELATTQQSRNSDSVQTFELSGVADGEYVLTASRFANGITNTGFSKIQVKGIDVSGISISMASMAEIEGHLKIEPSDAVQCRLTAGTTPREFFVRARIDRRNELSQLYSSNLGSAQGGVPDSTAKFKIGGLFPGTYRLEIGSPSSQWFIRSIESDIPAAPRSESQTKPVGAAVQLAAGFSLKPGENKSGLSITISAGGGVLRGRVEAGTNGTSVPQYISVVLVPADLNQQKSILRFSEAFMNSGKFEVGNVAPGRYYVVAIQSSKADFADSTRDPTFFDPRTRASLIEAATAAKQLVEFKPCQTVSDLIVHPTPFVK